MNTDPPENQEDEVQNSSKWQGKDGGGCLIDSVVLAAGWSVLGVFQSHH